MNRQPIPDAGAKLSQYYRTLSEKNNETIPEFLVREDTLDFSKYEVTEAELKTFCGMDPNVSYYVPGDLDGDDPDSESGSQRSHTTVKPDDDQGSKGFPPHGSSKKGSSSRSDPAPRPIKKKKKDLIERLMEKGLIPPAAPDILGGWMVLEMASSSDMDKALVKASSQNKLGYDSIRQALRAMHEDRDQQSGVGHKGKGKGYYAHWLMMTGPLHIPLTTMTMNMTPTRPKHGTVTVAGKIHMMVKNRNGKRRRNRLRR